MDEWSGLENRRGFAPSVGSNPTPSAIFGVLFVKTKGKLKGDLILIVVIVLIGLGVLVYNQIAVPKSSPGRTVVVEIDGEAISEFDLSADLAPHRIETKYGYNVLEIDGGQVRVVDADCPDRLCVHTGWRQHAGQVIVCLPHYFVVRVVGDSDDDGNLDGFTY